MIALIFLSPSLLAILLASLLLVRCYRTPPQAGRLGLALAGVAALLVAAVTWDQRSPPLRDAERRYGQEHLLSDKVGPALDVYWDDRHLLHLWFLAGTPSYTSLVQGSGLIYSREKAMEWKRRMSVVRNLKPDEPFTIEAAPPISATDVNRVCRDPELDYVVLTSQTDGRDSISFRWQGRQYFLADCRTRR